MVPGILECASPAGTVAASNRLIAHLPPGRRIRRIYIECLSALGVALTRAQMITDIASVEVRVNANPLFDPLLPADLFAIQNYLGAAGADGAANDGAIRLDFAQIPGAYIPARLASGGVVDGESLGLGTQNAGPIEVHILLTAGLATLGRVRTYVEFAADDDEPGLVRRLKQTIESAWATGKQDLVIPQRKMIAPDGSKLVDRLLAVHIIDPLAAAVLDDVEVWQGSTMVQRLYATTLGRNLQTQHRTAQAGYFHLELSRDGTLLGGLQLDPESPGRIALTFSTAPGGPFRAIYDIAAPWYAGSGG